MQCQLARRIAICPCIDFRFLRNEMFHFHSSTGRAKSLSGTYLSAATRSVKFVTSLSTV